METWVALKAGYRSIPLCVQKWIAGELGRQGGRGPWLNVGFFIRYVECEKARQIFPNTSF